MIFKDREDAGEKLALHLEKFNKAKDTLILALPRGGVVVAKKISKKLDLPLDIVIPRKIGAPFNPELAIGAICEEEKSLNLTLISQLGIDENYIKETIEQEKIEAKRRKSLYRQGKGDLNLKNKTLILVDDGIATGSTMEVSIKYVKGEKPKKIIVAVPVAPAHIIEEFNSICDEIICLFTPMDFMAVGQFYKIFPQTTDKEVITLLKNH